LHRWDHRRYFSVNHLYYLHLNLVLFAEENPIADPHNLINPPGLHIFRAHPGVFAIFTFGSGTSIDKEITDLCVALSYKSNDSFLIQSSYSRGKSGSENLLRVFKLIITGVRAAERCGTTLGEIRFSLM